MRRIDLLRTLALSSALILVLGGTTGASAEDASDDAGESPCVEAAPPDEAPEEAADETSPPAEQPDTEASEAEDE